MLNQFAVEIPTLPVNQCLSHLIQYRKDVETFFRNAEPQRRAAKHLGHAWYIGKRFLQSTCIFISSLSSRIESMEFIARRAAPFIHSGKRVRDKHKNKIGDASLDSQKFCHLQWRRLFQARIMEQTNNDCSFRIFISTNSLHQPHLFVGR